MVPREPPAQVLGIEREVDMRAWRGWGPPGCMWDGVWEILCREKPGVTPRVVGTQEKMGGEGGSARFVWD